ncbi:MAG: hypothetical protein U9R58_11230 [Chloroflexota bacterium]|nr:hypothetical protein [Chloroflexota bacterium]
MNSTPSLAKKNKIYILTFVDKETRCILTWKVSHKRSGYEIQELVTDSVQGHDYYSDDYEAYKTVLYWLTIHAKFLTLSIRARPTLLKVPTLTYITIWLVCIADLVISLDAS